MRSGRRCAGRRTLSREGRIATRRQTVVRVGCLGPLIETIAGISGKPAQDPYAPQETKSIAQWQSRPIKQDRITHTERS